MKKPTLIEESPSRVVWEDLEKRMREKARVRGSLGGATLWAGRVGAACATLPRHDRDPLRGASGL